MTKLYWKNKLLKWINVFTIDVQCLQEYAMKAGWWWCGGPQVVLGFNFLKWHIFKTPAHFMLDIDMAFTFS